MNTLESAGYVFEPHVTSDVFGSHASHFGTFGLQRSAHAALPTAATGDKQLDLAQGSGVPAGSQRTLRDTTTMQPEDKNVLMFLLLAGAIAFVVMYQ